MLLTCRRLRGSCAQVASYEAQLKGYFLVVNTFGNLAGTLRIGMRMPKYPLWVFMGVLTQLSRYTIEQPTEYPFPWLAAYALSHAVLLGVGARKILRAPRSAPPAEETAAVEEKQNGTAHDPMKIKSG